MNPFKRPPHTLLYLTGGKLCRLDSDRKGQIISQVEIFDCTCENSGNLPYALENFINQTSQPLGRKVWILYSRLHTYQLSVPAEQIAGLDSSFVKQALQFEYESITGESLINSQLSYHFLNTVDEMSHFWLNFIGTETLTHLIDLLKKSRSTLAGLTHAGGLPHLLTSKQAASWLKIEYWPNCVYALSKTPEHGLQLQIYHPEHNSHWQEELNHWVLETGSVEQSESLTTNTELEKYSHTDNHYFLTPDANLQAWLVLWMQYLTTDQATGIPLLRETVNVNTELLYSIASGFIALVLCGAHAGWMLYQTHYYQTEVSELNKTKQEIDNGRKTVTANQDKFDKLEKEFAALDSSLKSTPRAMIALKQRPAALLKILSEHSSDNLVVSDIKHLNQNLVISGAVLQAQASNQFATMIEQPLAALGWKVNAPTKQNLTVAGEAKPLWQFELVIEDLGLKGFLTQPKSSL